MQTFPPWARRDTERRLDLRAVEDRIGWSSGRRGVCSGRDGLDPLDFERRRRANVFKYGPRKVVPGGLAGSTEVVGSPGAGMPRLREPLTHVVKARARSLVQVGQPCWSCTTAKPAALGQAVTWSSQNCCRGAHITRRYAQSGAPDGAARSASSPCPFAVAVDAERRGRVLFPIRAGRRAIEDIIG